MKLTLMRKRKNFKSLKNSLNLKDKRSNIKRKLPPVRKEFKQSKKSRLNTYQSLREMNRQLPIQLQLQSSSSQSSQSFSTDFAKTSALTVKKRIKSSRKKERARYFWLRGNLREKKIYKTLRQGRNPVIRYLEASQRCTTPKPMKAITKTTDKNT